jgi:hypothetical protein
MKGISHFTSAIAAATFIPGVVAASGDERSLILLLAGVFGLLPDWLDFKLARYFESAEVVIEPAALNFNAQGLAEQTAEAIHRAYAENRPITVQFTSAQFGPDRWRRYGVQFDSTHNAVVIRPGPLINSGGFAVAEMGDPGPVGRATLGAGPQLRYTYDGEMKVETMEGPSFEFRREGEEVEVSFLPWHRRWSHSLVLAGVFGLAGGLLFGQLAGWVVAVAFATHVLEDQLGHLGSNLWWPFTYRRGAGLKLMRSGDPIPNFITVLTACGLVLYNLNRFTTPPPYAGNLFLLWAVAVPALTGLIFYTAEKYKSLPGQTEQQRDALSETQETEAN